MRRDERLRRLFEIIPGFFTWTTIVGLSALSVIKPLWVAVFIICFDLYWVIRVGYFTTLLLFAYRRLEMEKKIDWLKRCEKLEGNGSLRYSDIYQAVLFPVYKEAQDILESSVNALIRCNYRKDRMVVALTIEERGGEAVWEGARKVQKKLKD